MHRSFCSAYLAVALLLAAHPLLGQRTHRLISPSGEIAVHILIGDSITYRLLFHDHVVVERGAMALLTNRGNFGLRPRLQSNRSREVRDIIINPVPFKRKEVRDHYNESIISFRGGYAINFRVYDDGIAYRFETSLRDSLYVNVEVAEFAFQPADTVFFPQVQRRDNVDAFHTSFEEPYRIARLNDLTADEFGFSPVLVSSSGVKAFITESDLIDYPGMFLRGSSGGDLHGLFAPYPAAEEVQGGEYKAWVVTGRHPYIARTKGKRAFPWRVIGVAAHDKDLLANDLVYRLATPPVSKDWAWVKTGMATDEWIISSNIYNVPFKAGFNTETYKYYVDFARKTGMAMVMLDAGWSNNDNLLEITPGLDLKEVVRYARENNIGIMLWTLAMTLDRQLEEAMRMFTALGIAGINVDFMDRDDQKTVSFYHRIADVAAQNKLSVMFHGAFKNAGFERTHPNAVTREAILGSEYNMWSDKATPDHDVMIPFIRMMSGPLDYEPGFLLNANQQTFRPLRDMVMSQGTRVHQLAMFVVYESPVQVFAGNPSQALLEPAYSAFMGSLPTTWDDIVPLAGKVGDYVVVARRKGNDWYIGALNDWTPRDVEVNLAFLNDGAFRATICEDGMNAASAAIDYRFTEKDITKKTTLLLRMAPGGGYVAKISPAN